MSKELIEVLKKLNLGVSYPDVIDLFATWALQERNQCQISEVETTHYYPKAMATQPLNLACHNDDGQ